MHPEAYDYVAGVVQRYGPFRRVVEFGSMDVNGSIRPLFTDAGVYVGVDPHPGRGVDVVADAATWQGDAVYDCVVCCEVFEHTASWPLIVRTAYNVLTDGGYFIVTCAGPGRGPHSQYDGNALRFGEHYENVEPERLAEVFNLCGFSVIELDQLDRDVRALGRRS